MKLLFNKSDVYKTRFFVYTYNDNNIRIVKSKYCRLPGFEDIDNTNTFVDYNSDEVTRCSLSRTKRNIREIALCNYFDYFVTLTINSEKSDRYSLDECQNLLKKLNKKIKRKCPTFRYIFITEKHKDGAFHFHGLVGGIYSDMLYTNVNGYLSCDIYSEFLGFNSFSKIRDYTKTCNYITKYITKDCIKNSHNQIYISSRGLKKASKEEFDFIDFVPSYSNDYCDILDIKLNELSREENLKLFYQLKKEK